MTIETSPYVVEAARRDIPAERGAVVMAAIENARALLSFYTDEEIYSPLYCAACARELRKILDCKNAYDRAVKSQ